MKQEFVFRKAELSDALRLSVLYKQVYIQTYGTEGVSTEFANFITKQFSVERLENTMKNHPDNLFVAVYKDNLIGVAEIEFDKKCPLNDIVAPELNKLYILEWFTGKGVGCGLMNEVEHMLASMGIDQIWLWVYVLNARAIAFYERQGYDWIGNAFFQMEQNKYENKVMVKKLAPVAAGSK